MEVFFYIYAIIVLSIMGFIYIGKNNLILRISMSRIFEIFRKHKINKTKTNQDFSKLQEKMKNKYNLLDVFIIHTGEMEDGELKFTMIEFNGYFNFFDSKTGLCLTDNDKYELVNEFKEQIRIKLIENQGRIKK